METPYDESGIPLYVKNPKKVYVSVDQTETAPLIRTLNSANISTTNTSATVFFSVDAKSVPSTLDTTTSTIKGILYDIDHAGSNSRSVNTNISTEGDLLVVAVEFTLTRLT